MENPAGEKVIQFGKELEQLINKHSMENTCDTPDFILAAFLLDCLEAFAKATNRRADWYGHPKRPSGSIPPPGFAAQQTVARTPELRGILNGLAEDRKE